MLGNPNTKISVKSRVSSVARTESTTPSSSSAFSLWDPNYTDPAWINDKVMLIPRLRNWVNTYYEPGTPIGITEYNWGAESHINGVTTQADILGIFGRESLDLAARWTTPDPTTPTYKAIKMYRNYDGNRSTFGDVSVSAAVLNPDNVAAFAAQRTSDGALTVMVISKYLSGTTPVSIGISNFSASGTAQVYQLTAANLINRLSDLSFTSTVNLTLPPHSITLLVIPTGTPNTPPGVPRSRFDVFAGTACAAESGRADRAGNFRSFLPSSQNPPISVISRGVGTARRDCR